MKEIKTYIIDGNPMQFNTAALRELFNNLNGRKRGKTKAYEIEIGDLIGVSPDAVHNWRFGQNGPSDVEMVKIIADYFKVDYKILLRNKKEVKSVQINERQKDSLKRIYDAIIEFLVTFRQTDGFNEYWHKLMDKGISSLFIEDELYEIADNEHQKVVKALLKEYIVLGKHLLYEQLEEYVYNDLVDIYSGKLSYAYRFEAGVEDLDGTRTTVTTSEDYIKSMNKINEIIDNYM